MSKKQEQLKGIFTQFAVKFDSPEALEDYKELEASKQKAIEILPPEEADQQKKSPFFNVPTSSATNLAMEVLGAGGNLDDLPERKAAVDKGTSYLIKGDGKTRQVIMKSPKVEMTIELADIDKLLGSNKAAKKLFTLALSKANDHAIFNGQLHREGISFPLQELVDLGMYSEPRSARDGFKRGMNTLTSLKIKGTAQITAKKKQTIDALEVLFTGANIKNGQCTIYLNERINWSAIASYYTTIPTYYYRLDNRASDLLFYIFYLARQHTKDIEERGYFTISFRAIQSRLQLPSEIGNSRPKQTIKDEIEEAVTEIEEKHSELLKNTELQLLPVYDENANIKEYLDNGYLKVTLEGDFSKGFIEISKDTAKQIEQYRKKQARIEESIISAKAAKGE